MLNPPTVLRPDQPWTQVQVLRGLGLAGQLLVEVRAMDGEARLAQRYEKFRNMGRAGIDFVEDAGSA